MTAHSSVVGGSTAARVIACPGSVVLSQQAPEQTSTVYAQEGSALHDLMELWLSEDRSEPDPEVIGQLHEGVRITEALYEQKLVPAMKFFNDTVPVDALFYTETVVSYDNAIPGAFGTADVLFTSPNRAGIVDWKFGDGEAVSAEGNAQLMFYLAGAVFFTHPDMFAGLDEFEAHIFQPFSDGREPHSHTVFTRDELAEFVKLLEAAYKRSKANDPELHVGDHCRRCPARAFCPKLRDAAAGMSEVEVKGMGKAEIEHWLEVAEQVETWIKGLREYALDYQRRNGDLDEWKVVDIVGHRRFKDQKAAEAWARSQRILVREFMVSKFASPAQLERVMKTHGIAKDRPDFLELIERPITGERLARKDAKGEAKAPVAATLAKLGRTLKAVNMRHG